MVWKEGDKAGQEGNVAVGGEAGVSVGWFGRRGIRRGRREMWLEEGRQECQ